MTPTASGATAAQTATDVINFPDGLLGFPDCHSFVLSATLVGTLGAVYGYSVGYFTTYTVFRLDFSLNMIVFCLIGGIGTLFGPVIGTAIMLFLTQVLLSRFLDIHLLITGALVVAIILLVPGGILGALKQRLVRRAPDAKSVEA